MYTPKGTQWYNETNVNGQMSTSINQLMMTILSNLNFPACLPCWFVWLFPKCFIVLWLSSKVFAYSGISQAFFSLSPYSLFFIHNDLTKVSFSSNSSFLFILMVFSFSPHYFLLISSTGSKRYRPWFILAFFKITYTNKSRSKCMIVTQTFSFSLTSFTLCEQPLTWNCFFNK